MTEAPHHKLLLSATWVRQTISSLLLINTKFTTIMLVRLICYNDKVEEETTFAQTSSRGGSRLVAVLGRERKW